MRFCTAFVLSFRLLVASLDEVTPSLPEEIAGLQPHLMVGGCVSVTSGSLSFLETDLQVLGAQPLRLERVYIHPNILGRYEDKASHDALTLGKELFQLQSKGWVVLPHLWCGYNRHSPHLQVRNARGTTLEFSLQQGKGVLQTSSCGCSNLGAEGLSAKNDIRNTSVSLENGHLHVRWPDGTLAIYKPGGAKRYRLYKELYLNGKGTEYLYSAGGALQEIRAIDRGKKHVYGQIFSVGEGHFRAADGREVRFERESVTIAGKKQEKKKREEASFGFSLISRVVGPLYSHAMGYNDRTLLTSYDKREMPLTWTYYETKGQPCRVHTLSTPESTTRLRYDPPVLGKKGGYTMVTHPSGGETLYRFSPNFLLVSIEKLWKGKALAKELFTYNARQHVEKVETMEGERVVFTKRYVCDERGNPTWEMWDSDCGVFTIERAFEGDLCVWEKDSNGKEVVTKYLEDTNLVLAKRVLVEGKALQETLFSYDAAYNLVGVEEVGKTRTLFSLYEDGPHLHRVFAKTREDVKGNLLYKIQYGYDVYGNVVREEHFDAGGDLSYTIEREYNERGELLSESDPLGNRALYGYDARGRVVEEVPCKNDLHIQRTFSPSGKLLVQQENEDATLYTYNGLGELSSKMDPLGSTTHYVYDPLCKKPTRVENARTHTLFTYDGLGRLVLQEDGMGGVTRTEYCGFSMPKRIVYPDGEEESFTYYGDGKLKSHISPSKLCTTYAYDPLGRLVTKTRGEYTTTYVYDGYNLLEVKNPLGDVVSYEYDLFNRKIWENRFGRRTSFCYSKEGFLEKELREDRSIHWKRDLLGRPLCKNIDDAIYSHWEYDIAGNVSSKTALGTTTYGYDSFDRLLWQRDPLGNTTYISYQNGPEVLYKTITNPMGEVFKEEYCPEGLLLTKTHRGTVLEKRSYDRALRLVEQNDLAQTYTKGGRLASRTTLCKTTKYHYNSAGQLSSTELPDHTKIDCTYDLYDRLLTEGSRTFVYDPLDRLVGGTHFVRRLDPFGNILEETWDTGASIATTYDAWDRPLTRTLFDKSTLHYTYEGPHLRTLVRKDPFSHVLYTHQGVAYNEQGQPLLQENPHPTRYTYDVLGRITHLQTPSFEEHLTYDGLGNVLQKGDISYTYDALSQLTSEGQSSSITYDTQYTPLTRNGMSLIPSYDENGNTQLPHICYDEFSQVLPYTYDALGRRIQKGNDVYFYIDQEEIGSIREGRLFDLKIEVQGKAVAIQVDETLYPVVSDAQGILRQVLDPDTHEILATNESDSFGRNTYAHIPFAYLGKRLDEETGLIYFGKRYYHPHLQRWLTPDPLGPIDHANLYQYLFNNPYRYRDPTGESIGGFLFGIGQILVGGTIALTGVALEIATFGGYTFALGFHEAAGIGLMSSGLVTATYHAQDLKGPSSQRTSHYKDSSTIPSKEQETSNDVTSPPYSGDTLGTDPAKPPSEEFEWKGNGSPGTKEGSWYNPATGESLHPDLDHPPPVKPHWDYSNRNGDSARLNTDGTWEWKK